MTPGVPPKPSPLQEVVNLLWKGVAKIVAIPFVANWLIKRAKRTPYFHLDGYMDRWWLFNPYGENLSQNEKLRHNRKWTWLPSIRVHHIFREDYARDMHDHPWNARTIILKGWYEEERLATNYSSGYGYNFKYDKINKYYRTPGDTARLLFGEYHNITKVSEGGVWTLFFTWDYMGTWGFLVNGKKVPWREYTNGGAA